MFNAYFDLAVEVRDRGEIFATAVVVRAESPTLAQPGDKAIITSDGRLRGWIGGSCAQPTVVRAALAAMADGQGRLIRISPEASSEAERPGYEEVLMTCFSGGTLDIFVEPHAPRPRLLVVGEQPIAQTLANLGRALDYEVVAVTSADQEDAMAHADRVSSDAEEIVELATDRTFVVVATHGQFDETAVAAAMRSPAPYVALVASKKRGQLVREFLATSNLGSELDRLRSPAGIEIGAQRGDEIALSIMAEIVQVRRTIAARLVSEPLPVSKDTDLAETITATAIDPVCGMTVNTKSGGPSVEHAGSTYFFCCQGCSERFAGAPESFLEPD